MRVLIVLLASLTAAAQQTKPPTYTTENITRQVAHCEAGWHLERWHYGTGDMNGNMTMNTPALAVYRVDPSGYRAVTEAKQEDPHPDRCVKDEPKK